jgi:hypothetical protein
MAQAFVPPTLDSHVGPADGGFVPPSLDSHAGPAPEPSVKGSPDWVAWRNQRNADLNTQAAPPAPEDKGFLSGLYDSVKDIPAMAAKVLTDPGGPASGYGKLIMGSLPASADQLRKAGAAWKAGEHVEALGHLGGAIPMIGPAAVKSGDDIGDGKIMYGLGEAAALLGPSLLGGAMELGAQSPKLAAVTKGAVKGAVKGATEMVTVPRYPMFSAPAAVAGGLGGLGLGTEIGSKLGVPKVGGGVGAVLGAGAPVVRGAIAGGRAAAAEVVAEALRKASRDRVPGYAAAGTPDIQPAAVPDQTPIPPQGGVLPSGRKVGPAPPRPSPPPPPVRQPLWSGNNPAPPAPVPAMEPILPTDGTVNGRAVGSLQRAEAARQLLAQSDAMARAKAAHKAAVDAAINPVIKPEIPPAVPPAPPPAPTRVVQPNPLQTVTSDAPGVSETLGGDGPSLPPGEAAVRAHDSVLDHNQSAINKVTNLTDYFRKNGISSDALEAMSNDEKAPHLLKSLEHGRQLGIKVPKTGYKGLVNDSLREVLENLRKLEATDPPAPPPGPGAAHQQAIQDLLFNGPKTP